MGARSAEQSVIDFWRVYHYMITAPTPFSSTAGRNKPPYERCDIHLSVSGNSWYVCYRWKRYYSQPFHPQTSDHPCFACMPRLTTLLSEVVGKFPLHGPDPGFVLPLTGKPDASDTKTQIGRE